MEDRSVSRELALLLLGQISDTQIQQLEDLSVDKMLSKVIDTLMDHWRESLDFCANEIEIAQEHLEDSEFKEDEKGFNNIVRNHLSNSLSKSQKVVNNLSEIIELTHLLALSNQEKIRNSAIQRVSLVINKLNKIDKHLDDVMEGWRLKRLPRIDRDILRLAFIDLNNLNTPVPVACDEAVNLANRYSDEQGRRMINGILRRLQNAPL